MRIQSYYICTYLLPVLPSLLEALVLLPQTNVSLALPPVKYPGIAEHGGGGGINAPTPHTSHWCRPIESELDLLFSTHAGQPLELADIMYVVGVLREVAQREIKEKGRNGRIEQKPLRISLRGINLTLLDQRLDERTWGEIHDAMDVLLLCVYLNKIAAETRGTFFDIKTQTRLAVVVIAKRERLGDEGGDIAAS
ncbi:MAG: hypothetical protein LQ346_002345 [Caloplaca aetnensis]|nr:MAG: hypothetical protein LQ346_002345 [Caloplaca aetnensis]